MINPKTKICKFYNNCEILHAAIFFCNQLKTFPNISLMNAVEQISYITNKVKLNMYIIIQFVHDHVYFKHFCNYNDV